MRMVPGNTGVLAVWAVLGACGVPAAAQGALVVFVHDQSSDEILRMQDLNGDGDAHDPGEATVFFDDGPPVTGVDNAQGLVALGPGTVLATDNFDPDNIVYLDDANGDGDAFDSGENTVWFAGLLPVGLTMTNPSELRARPDGSFFMLDNNTLDTTRPEAIYVLEDLNSDNDVDDVGEVVPFFTLSAIGASVTTTFDVVQDTAGNVYTLDITDDNSIESIDVIDPSGSTKREWLDSSQLFGLAGVVLVSTVNELEYDPAADEVIFGANALGGSQRIMAARDRDGSGVIDAAGEVRTLWDESGHAGGFNTGSPRDLFRTDDGRILWTDGLADRVMMLTDLNADGDFNDVGETVVYFDADTAASNGLPTISLPLSISAVGAGEPCLVDYAEPFGVLDFFDIAAFLSLYNAQDPAADLADPPGSWDFFDVSAFLSLYNAGCP